MPTRICSLKPRVPAALASGLAAPGQNGQSRNASEPLFKGQALRWPPTVATATGRRPGATTADGNHGGPQQRSEEVEAGAPRLGSGLQRKDEAHDGDGDATVWLK